MPFAYTIDASRRLVVTRNTGVLTDADVTEIRAQFAVDPGFDPTYTQLSDLRDLTDITLSSRMINEIGKNSVFRPSRRRAYIATTPLQYGMARMLASLADAHGQTVHVFRSMGAAEIWMARDATAP